jgi:divalent metal cation (Fe/Co/Zn/Cd) transporter
MPSPRFEAKRVLSSLSRLQRMALLSIATALITMALKFWSWQLSGSVSLLSDAIESLVNLAAALLAFTVLTIAARPADADHPFGHGKAEYFSSAAEGLLIIFAAIGIALTAWDRLFAATPLHDLSWGLYLAAVAAAFGCVDLRGCYWWFGRALAVADAGLVGPGYRACGCTASGADGRETAGAIFGGSDG